MRLAIAVVVFSGILYQSSLGSLVAVSKIEECFASQDGTPELLNQDGNACGRKIVVALTLSGNESKSQYLQANISLVTNYTDNKRERIRQPFRIRIEKSPVKIVHRLHPVGVVNHLPYEETIGVVGKCRDDWYAENWEAPCGFQYDNSGAKIFDSQGMCCTCYVVGNVFYRARAQQCHNSINVAHCLRKHWLSHTVFDLHPAERDFDVIITIEQYDYGRLDGSEVWKTRGVLRVGPNKRVVRSEDITLKVSYVGDLASTRGRANLQSKYLLVPRLSDVNSAYTNTELFKNMTNSKNWLLVDRHLVDLKGLFCDRIGTSFRAFRNQGNLCYQPHSRSVHSPLHTTHADRVCVAWLHATGLPYTHLSTLCSCLQGQPHHLYMQDLEALSEGRRGQYLLRHFGRIPPLHHDLTALELLSSRIQRSLITLTMEADGLQSVANFSPGRIVDVFIAAFEALSADGLLEVIIENTGSISAGYQVTVLHCSAGIEYLPAQSIVLDPGEVSNVTFTVYSFHAVSQINSCEVELYDERGILLDNQTISFTTFDTCFCHGYCGCSCGSNVSNCPAPPDLKDSLIPNEVPDILNFFLNLALTLGRNLAAFIILGIILHFLIILGILKVILMIATGEVKCDYLWMAIGMIVMATTGVPMFVTNMVRGQLATKGDHGIATRCNGMCAGARKARREHRKMLRIKKRKGKNVKDTDVWWQKPYECTCSVKDTKNILQIIKGTCFFIYCPILPFIWIIQFAIEQWRRRKRRQKRKRVYREEKTRRRAAKQAEFLSMDDYSRGKKTKKKFNERRVKIDPFEMEEEDDNESAVSLAMDDSSRRKKKTKSKKKTKTDSATEPEDYSDDRGAITEDDGDDRTSETESRPRKSKQKKGKRKKKKASASRSAEESQEVKPSQSWEIERRDHALEGEDSMDTDARSALSDTSDEEEAHDIEELLDPGYPVYLNYSAVPKEDLPSSLMDPGKVFSLKGRLVLDDNSDRHCVFDLYKYLYQTHKVVKDKRVALDVPAILEPELFILTMENAAAVDAVTLAPLFPCINSSKLPKR